MNKKNKNAEDKIEENLKIGDELMIKKIAWDTFKNTGDITTYLELKQIENIESNIKEIENIQKITNTTVQENKVTENDQKYQL